MPPEIESDESTTYEPTTADADAADETATSASPADDASSSAASASEEGESPATIAETPEAKAEREKGERIKRAEEEERRAEESRKERQRVREQAEREERIAFREQEANRLLQRAQAALDDLERRADVVRRGGYDALKALGIDYSDWTKKTLEETSPDAVAQRALQRVDQLEAELKRREQAEEQRKEQARQQEAVETAKKRFEGFVEENGDDFPDAATLPAKALHILASEASHEYYREHGSWPSFTVLLPRLDRKAKEFHDEQKQRSAKRTRSSESPRDGVSTQALTTGKGQPANAPANRTLTPAAATTRATPPRQMTPEEEDEWALAELRQALAADSKTAG